MCMHTIIPLLLLLLYTGIADSEYLKLIVMMVFFIFPTVVLVPTASGLSVALSAGCAILLFLAAIWRLFDQCWTVTMSFNHKIIQTCPQEGWLIIL